MRGKMKNLLKVSKIISGARKDSHQMLYTSNRAVMKENYETENDEVPAKSGKTISGAKWDATERVIDSFDEFL